MLRLSSRRAYEHCVFCSLSRCDRCREHPFDGSRFWFCSRLVVFCRSSHYFHTCPFSRSVVITSELFWPSKSHSDSLLTDQIIYFRVFSRRADGVMYLLIDGRNSGICWAFKWKINHKHWLIRSTFLKSYLSNIFTICSHRENSILEVIVWFWPWNITEEYFRQSYR